MLQQLRNWSHEKNYHDILRKSRKSGRERFARLSRPDIGRGIFGQAHNPNDHRLMRLFKMLLATVSFFHAARPKTSCLFE